jgi:hypothetical protein
MIAPLAEQVRSEVVNNAPSMIASSVALCLSNMAGISPHWSALNSSHSEPCFAFVSNRPRAGLSEPGSLSTIGRFGPRRESCQFTSLEGESRVTLVSFREGV